jgi:hypothetical protein
MTSVAEQPGSSFRNDRRSQHDVPVLSIPEKGAHGPTSLIRECLQRGEVTSSLDRSTEFKRISTPSMM